MSARDTGQFTALERAALGGHLDVVDRLIEGGATVPPDSRALAWASRQGHRTVVRVLLNAGADPNTPLPMGWTALMFAAEAGEEEIVSDLLAAGADASATTMNGYTALRSARERGHNGIVRLLEEAGAEN